MTDPSLVRQMCIMNAKIEKLQQDQIQSKKAAADREKKVEKHLKEQAREITALKRKRCDSCSSEGPSNSSSAPKQVHTAEALREAIEEAKKVEIDNSE